MYSNDGCHWAPSAMARAPVRTPRAVRPRVQPRPLHRREPGVGFPSLRRAAHSAAATARGASGHTCLRVTGLFDRRYHEGSAPKAGAMRISSTCTYVTQFDGERNLDAEDVIQTPTRMLSETTARADARGVGTERERGRAGRGRVHQTTGSVSRGYCCHQSECRAPTCTVMPSERMPGANLRPV